MENQADEKKNSLIVAEAGNVARVVLDDAFRASAECSEGLDRSDPGVEHALGFVPISFLALVAGHLLRCGLDEFSGQLEARTLRLGLDGPRDGRLDAAAIAIMLHVVREMAEELPPVDREEDCRLAVSTVLEDAYREVAQGDATAALSAFPADDIAATVVRYAKDRTAWIDGLGLMPAGDMPS